LVTVKLTETVAGATRVELPDAVGAAVLELLKALPVVLCDFAYDGATALMVRMVARPRLTAVVVTTADFFFMGFLFRWFGVSYKTEARRDFCPKGSNAEFSESTGSLLPDWSQRVLRKGRRCALLKAKYPESVQGR
jgi:hypothetical protein